MNVIKERRKQGAVCSVCRSPDYRMTPPITGETTKPSFTCNQCGNVWCWGKDGGKYSDLYRPNASVSIPGGEPGYAPRSCSVISLRFKGGDITHQLNHATYHKLKASGMLWELYPDAPDVFPSQNAANEPRSEAE